MNAPRRPSAARGASLGGVLAAGGLAAGGGADPAHPAAGRWVERQVTSAPHGHMLTNIGCWSGDGRWIAYDVRDQDSVFSGTRIEAVDVATGEIRVLLDSSPGSCGVATCDPGSDACVFILGPERPSPDWTYGPARRGGAVVHASRPGVADSLDARCLAPPFIPGALRGGTHLHTFSPDGAGWVASTYEDHVLDLAAGAAGAERNQRNVAVSVPAGSVAVPRSHPRNRDGSHFTVLVTRTHDAPRPGSDEISRACEEGWVGTAGYVRPDGTRQCRAIAFQGTVTAADGRTVVEAFLVDLPETAREMTVPGEGPLEGTATTRPRPPRGVVQRRLTRTADLPNPGIQGPRHWLRGSPDGSRIAMLRKDADGIAQLWTVSPCAGLPGGPAPEPVQLTRNPWPVASSFSWSPDGRWIAFVADGSVMATDAATGATLRLTPRAEDAAAPQPFACVVSPDGRSVAYQRAVVSAGGRAITQVFVCSPIPEGVR
ncbi:MAG: DUF3748 domain-containing protein [Lentisphaerae bacterium]|nr:DUF3748 domain-containing protein [Lentisphaerota bacterium]